MLHALASKRRSRRARRARRLASGRQRFEDLKRARIERMRESLRILKGRFDEVRSSRDLAGI